MTIRYLLDTNIVSELIRHPREAVARRVKQVGERTVATSIVVAAELRYGAAKATSDALRDRVDRMLSVLEILPLHALADRTYAEIRHFLGRQGTPIGPNDLLIAAHALATDLTLVTANLREFQRVPKLRVENWLDGEPNA